MNNSLKISNNGIGGRVAIMVVSLAILVLALVSGPAGAATVTDEIGRRVEVPDRPARIITLSPSLTEIVFALGLGDRLVGVTRWSDVPAEAKKLPQVGAYISPNLELIVSQAPDLVLANYEGNPPWVVEKLTQAGIAVYVTQPSTPQALPASIRRLGRVCGAPVAGERLAREMEAGFARVENLVSKARPVKCLLLVGRNPAVAAGTESFHGRLLKLAGGDNAAAGAPGTWPRLSLEYVVKSRPEVIILSTMERGAEASELLAHWRSVPGLDEKSGVRIEIVSSDLLDRPGPRMIAGLEALARAIHPDLFPNKGQAKQ